MTALLLAALIAVESAGNPHAIGDHGQAVGVLQIHEEVVRDVNRFAHMHYSHADARDPAKAEAICYLYVNHYATAARLGHAPTNEDRARIWNGGSRGWQKPASRKARGVIAGSGDKR